MIPLIIDIVIVAIVLLFTFLGYKRGLIKVAIKLCTFFIAIIVAFTLYKPATNLIIEKTNLDESISSTIANKLLPEGSSEEDSVDESIKLPEIILKQGSNTIKDVAASFATLLIQIVCFLIIFILVKIILKFVTLLADLIAKLPIIKQFNELGGTLYGVLEGLFIVFVLFAIISLISPLIDVKLLSYIDSSTIGSWIYNNNLLIKLIA